MNIDLLGPLSARLGERVVTPSAAKPRKVFALLAVHANEVVSIGALHEELWGDSIPRSASTTLQTYVLHLRNRIGAALRHAPAGRPRDPKSVLVTRPGGYLLDTHGGSVDVIEFERLAQSGHRAHKQGDPGLASALYGRALAQWKGEALIDVRVGLMLEVDQHCLEEARLNVIDRRIDAELRLGCHHELLGELTALVARHPTHEGFWGYLVLALYRSGRRGEAINAYHRLRENLVRDLGLEPSPPLGRLHHMVLAADPRLTSEARPAEVPLLAGVG